MKTFLPLFLLLGLAMSTKAAVQIDIVGPPGSDDFGTSVTMLPNGNFVVTDPGWDQPSPVLTNAGAVYLYSSNWVLISTLKGSAANNQVGSAGVTVLKNGNFLVRSELWDNTSPAATDAGAVTFGNASTGFGATVASVSSANSLVGSTLNDHVGQANPASLSNGNYVVSTPDWDIPSGAANVGAATFGNGSTGTSGAISTSNSLTGSTAGDQIGFYGVVPVGNGNYVVRSHLWDGPGAADAGAVTWCNGTNGKPFSSATAGVAVSSANSLVGSTASDQVSYNGLTVLPSGNFVVISSNWDDTANARVDAGAVTFVLGNFGQAGALSITNSLIGLSTGDQVGSFGITILSTGDYVVGSPEWDIPSGAANVGAVTQCSGTGGLSGGVSAVTSLIGSTVDDRVGGYGIFALTNGNYVVASGDWDVPAGPADVGAITWRSGTGVTSGVVGVGNSFVGSTADDRIGSTGVFPLPNGNYVVASPNWDAPSAVDAGAATWGNGATGSVGTISASNSLVGSSPFDQVGGDFPVVLTNGNYVVVSPDWSIPGGAAGVGAVTWGKGTTGVKGTISSSNSLIGKTAFDDVGRSGVFPLTNGNYVVCTSNWDNPSPTLVTNVGAATWCNGSTGTKGVVSASNSLIGSTTGDEVGRSGATPLENGHYVVRSPRWDNGALDRAGAATWGNGTNGIKGIVSTANSIVGTTANDQVGSSIRDYSNGTYLLRTNNWDKLNPATVDSGAFTPSPGTGLLAGVISASNSILGTAASQGFSMDFDYDALHDLFIIGRHADNIVTIFGNQLKSLAKTNLAAPGAIDIAFSTPGIAALNANGDAIYDYKLTGAGSTSGRNQALFNNGDLVLQSGANLSTLGTGLPSNSKLLTLISPLYQQTGRALFQATISGTGITSSSNKLLLMDNGSSVTVLRRTGQTVGTGTLFSSIPSSFQDIAQSHDQDLIAINYTLKTETITPVTTSSDTGLMLVNHLGAVLPNLAARENEPAFGGGGTFGQFTGHSAAAQGTTIHFGASFKPTSGAAKNALFSTTIDGTTTARTSLAGDLATGVAPPAAFSTYTGICQQGAEAVVKATLTAAPSGNNEGLWRLPSNTNLLRKSEEIFSGFVVSKIIRFWPAGTSQVIAHVQYQNGQSGVALLQADLGWLSLIKTGDTPSGIDAAKISAISAVDVNPVNGRYVILSALSGAPSSANQALWVGNTSLGADTPATSQALRLPTMRLRKGDRYSTTETPLGIIKSITLKPTPDTTGTGGRGLGQCISANGNVAVFLLGDRNLTELVLVP